MQKMTVDGHTYITLKHRYLYHIKKFIRWSAIIGRMTIGMFVLAFISRFEMPYANRLLISFTFFCYIIYPILGEVLSLMRFKIEQ